jgi:hypothetical protein
MAKDQKSKKLYYRRATWEKQGKATLEALLNEAHDTLTTVGRRTFQTSGGEIRGARVHPSDKGLLLQIAAYAPGEPTSTIDKNKSAKASTIAAEPAPEGKDYLDGDIFVLVNGNHVILCPSGVRETVATNYFIHALTKVGNTKIATTLGLDKVAKTSKLKMIQDEGVKEILLHSSLYEASLLHADAKSSSIGGFRALIAQQMERIFAKDPELQAISELENLNISLSIRFNGKEGRKRHADPQFGTAGRARLIKASQRVLDEHDDGDSEGFVIITGQNNQITADEVRVSDKVSITALGKSLSHTDAWDKLTKYYEQLKGAGVLSQ